MTSGEYLKFIDSLYKDSTIPVVVFTDDMRVVWYNDIVTNYFSPTQLKEKTVSALFKTAIKDKLFNSPGYSAKFEIKLKDKNRLSSEINMLVYPIESRAGRPRLYSAFIDDITEERRMTLRKTYLGLLEASKLKDDDTGNHIKRVGAYAKRLSEELYRLKMYDVIDLEFIENIHFLAPMHDVGKIGTPDEILNKRGPLTDAEWRIMKEHTINGAFILSNYPEKMAMEIARAHHEKWNGEGYPYNLSGEDIPLAARITAVADVYDALRMKRSYKNAFTHPQTVDIIKEDSGSHFDPSIIDVFLSISDSFNDIFDALSDSADVKSLSDYEELPVYIDDNENPEELEEI